MEIILTDDNIIFMQIHKVETALWCSRHSGQFSIHPSWDLAGESNPECLGTIMGFIGKITIHSSIDQQLLVIREADRVTELPGSSMADTHPVYRIRSVALLPITPEAFTIDQPLKTCHKHNTGNIDFVEGDSGGGSPVKFPFKSLGGKIKTAGNSIKNTAGNAAAGFASQVKVPWKRDNGVRGLEKLEKKLQEEVLKLFNENPSFYFSFTGDVTNSLQRQFEAASARSPEDNVPLWKRVDDRFFFNKKLVAELMELEDTRVDHYILPIMQGYIETQDCSLSDEFLRELELQPNNTLPSFYQICLISRRSRHRAGTRYKRRGVDEQGHVANYVETEQILLYYNYGLSFVTVRGSVPVFWSQPGYKYRPPPVIHRTDVENQASFATHFNQLFAIYNDPVNCISLVERSGREKVLADAFLENVLIYNQPKLSYISFDFHEHCRGMRFENVGILLDTIEELIQRQGFFWADHHGQVLSQSGIFRVNCVDCLDRTNVIQTAIARKVLEIQLAKLGVVQPEQGLTDQEKIVFQALWANNGDSISRQYAGTNALKGDYTRTGERNLSGLVKDGVNSASRYYLNHMRDTYRQAAIDIAIGDGVSDEILAQIETVPGGGLTGAGAVPGGAPATASIEPEQVRSMVEESRNFMLTDPSLALGAWALIDADLSPPNEANNSSVPDVALDLILLLTSTSYLVARYDEDLDKVVEYQEVNLVDITKLEFGVMEHHSFNLPFLPGSGSKASATGTAEIPCLRICYKVGDVEGYHHMLRGTGFKVFNNTVTVINTDEEKSENLRSLVDSMAVATEALCGRQPQVLFGQLEKRKSRPRDVNSLPSAISMSMSRPSEPSRSGPSLSLSNMTSRISKLNPISKLMTARSDKLDSVRFTDVATAVEAQQDMEAEGDLIQMWEPDRNSASALDGTWSQRSQPPVINKDLLAVPWDIGSRGDPRTGTSRHRKISRSSEDLTSSGGSPGMSAGKPTPAMAALNPIDSMLAPFARLSHGLAASLGSNLEDAAKLSRSCEQMVAGGLSAAATIERRHDNSPAGEPVDQDNARLERQVTRMGCQSLILNI